MPVPGPMAVPGLSMTLASPCSILIGFTTFHFPSGNFWNEPHGALPVTASTGGEANITEYAKAARTERFLIMGMLVSRSMLWLARMNCGSATTSGQVWFARKSEPHEYSRSLRKYILRNICNPRSTTHFGGGRDLSGAQFYRCGPS
jgi:hypothetical protein